MSALDAWVEGLPVSVTVTAADGTIVAMNARAREAYAFGGGADLIGSNVLDCHPEPARAITARLYASRAANHYTATKDGQTRIVHQMPWYQEGEFAGLVEIVIPLPAHLPHFDRDS